MTFVHKPTMTVREAIRFTYESYLLAKVPNRPRDRDFRHPEWTGQLLKQLGNPDEAAPAVVVTGSKGKGSHAVLLAAMLQQLGFRVGLFTGPHLVDFMERFRCNGEMIPEPEFADYMSQVADVVRKLAITPGQYIGPVGILAAVAALWFRDMKTDINVVECGRGALHDDVNQWHHDGAVIAPIFLEHEWELGPTLADIAMEKSGVMTPATKWVVSHQQSPEVASLLEIRRHTVNAKLYMLNRDFSYQSDPDEAHLSKWTNARVVTNSCLPPMSLTLPRNFQYLTGNAAVALEAARMAATAFYGWSTFPQTLDLRRVRLPGRMHIAQHNPLILIDGAIHGESAKYVANFAKHLKLRHHIRHFGALVGIPDDKDGTGVLKALVPVADWVIIARTHNPHLKFDAGWENCAKSLYENVTAVPYIEDGLELAKAWLSDEDGLLVLGTQSFVGDALSALHQNTTSIWNLEETESELW